MNNADLKPFGIKNFAKMKQTGEKITMLTAYDFSTAKYIDEAGIDVILVGDSVGMTVLGYENTLKVTVDDMVTFTKAVASGVKRAFVVADMPFLSCGVSKEKTIENAGKLILAGAGAVKIEGASDFILDEINRLTDCGINVIGHLGFTPQYIKSIGGCFVQGKSFENTVKLYEASRKVEQSGAIALVLEMVPEETAQYITEKLSIPVIGIGAGKYCDGQVLVIDDILGKFPGFVPKFVKQYANVKDVIISAASAYINDVKNSVFPSDENSFKMSYEEKAKFEHYINE